MSRKTLAFLLTAPPTVLTWPVRSGMVSLPQNYTTPLGMNGTSLLRRLLMNFRTRCGTLCLQYDFMSCLYNMKSYSGWHFILYLPPCPISDLGWSFKFWHLYRIRTRPSVYKQMTKHLANLWADTVVITTRHRYPSKPIHTPRHSTHHCGI